MDEISSQIWFEEINVLSSVMDDQMSLEELHQSPMPWEDEDKNKNNDNGRDKGKNKREDYAEEVNYNKKLMKKAKHEEDINNKKANLEDAKEKANRDKNAKANNLQAHPCLSLHKAAKGEENNKEATHVWWCPNCGASPSYYCASECDGQMWIPKTMVEGKTKEKSKQKPNHPKGYSKRKSSDALE